MDELGGKQTQACAFLSDIGRRVDFTVDGVALVFGSVQRFELDIAGGEG